MKIAIDVAKIISTGLSFEQYVFCHLIHLNRRDLLLAYVDLHGPFSLEKILELERLEFIVPIAEYENLDINTVLLTEKFANLLEKEEFVPELILNQQIEITKSFTTLFEEWWAIYPKKRNNGSPLRTRKIDCEREFKKLCTTVTGGALAIKIMEATKAATETHRSNNFQYMKNTYNFLIEKAYNDYDDKIEELKNEDLSDSNSFDNVEVYGL